MAVYTKSLKAQGKELAAIEKQLELLKACGQPSFAANTNTNLNTSELEILQLNLGKMCNQVCEHCHVDAGPDRKEIMEKDTMEACLKVIDESDTITTVDLTGGAPEMNPHFEWLVEELSQRKIEVIVRSNLTILVSNKKYDKYPMFFKKHGVHVIASLPCYTAENTDKQRGIGVFDSSLKAIKALNEVGYGNEDSALKLDFVFNPGGPSLPGNQAGLEADYKKVLGEQFQINFNNLYTITNLPISRFLEYIESLGKTKQYMQLLVDNFNPSTIDELMCKNTLSVSWDGKLYDCDFNQMLQLPIQSKAKEIFDFKADDYKGRKIATNQHCYGCTAGAGSSCQGALN